MECGTGPLYISYNQLVGQSSTISALTYSQFNDNSKSWNFFRMTELYNSNVSTQHAQGNSNIRYYQYQNYGEQIKYTVGQNLYFTYLGFSNVVQKN